MRSVLTKPQIGSIHRVRPDVGGGHRLGKLAQFRSRRLKLGRIVICVDIDIPKAYHNVWDLKRIEQIEVQGIDDLFAIFSGDQLKCQRMDTV